MQKVPRPYPKPKRWNFTPPNGWRAERVAAPKGRKPTARNWAWQPKRAEQEAKRQRDRAKLEAAWDAMTGVAT